MPVYERGYRRWERSGNRPTPAWWAMARRGITSHLKKRGFLLLLAAAWVPAVVKGGFIYFSDVTRLLGTSWSDVTPAGFLEFLVWQSPFVLIVTAVVGSGLITRDREENGLALYFSRPLTLRDYIAGKAAIIIFFHWAVTLFPLVVLSLFGYAVTHEATGSDLLVWIPLRGLLFCSLSAISMALVLLALSAMGRRTVFVALWWILLVAGSETIAEIMGQFRPWLKIVDFAEQYLNAGAPLFGVARLDGVSPLSSLALVIGYTLLAVLILRRRIRPVEVA